eukprot:TRINITY_DN898_c2_g1_i2.p1 TRINITY_DN898_c2_g1~~TRINITY_DN898_c2_g1_i2.p1  ORF type:complete len:657 (+),score=123.59 TRINITY_DN898_c2_g1_i2:81-2051(+)
MDALLRFFLTAVLLFASPIWADEATRDGADRGLAVESSEGGSESSSTTEAPAETETTSAAPETTAPAPVVQSQDAVKMLAIKTDAEQPFTSGSAVLFEHGQTLDAFTCGPSGNPVGAEDGPSMGFRSLLLSQAQGESPSMFENVKSFVGASEAESEGDSLKIVGAKVSVTTSDGKSDGLPVLHAAVEPKPSTEQPLQVPEHSATPPALTVIYDCWREGTAEVELRLTVSKSDPSSKGDMSAEVCLKWKKVCGKGFGELVIKHEERSIHPMPEDPSAAKTDIFSPEGIVESVTKLSLESSGALRLRPPVVSSPQKYLQVDVSGSFADLGDGAADAFEVSNINPVEFSVRYSCEADGLADVTLTLEKAVIDDAHRPETLQISWKKMCGMTVYRNLEVYIKSEYNRTKKQAVAVGAAMPGFRRACPRSTGKGVIGKATPSTTLALAQGPSAPGAEGPPGANCDVTPPIFEVNPKDLRTNIDLKVLPAGVHLPPSFQPLPDLSYDRKLMRAQIVQYPTASIAGSKGKGTANQKYNPKAVTSHMAIKYTCFRDGVTTVMLTLHVLAHKPIDVVWRKRCTEPKVKVGKALTAPQAMMFAFLVCGCIGMIICACFTVCSTDDKAKKNLFKQVPNGSGEDVEFGDRRPQIMGKMGGRTSEVTYH